MPNSAHPQADPQPTGRGLEYRDVNIKWIMFWIGMLIATGVVIHFVVGWQFAGYYRRHVLMDQQAARQEVVPDVAMSLREFPEPRLQVSPPLDLQELRAREDAELNNYGWVDRKTGVVRIPVERAIDIIAQKGLPAWASTNQGGVGPSMLQLIQGRRGQYVAPPPQPAK
ncbi:MAG: hypothetical protein JWR19_1587 [Pedosphaera sp.]|nr:hypothetical protein [Pedosphaera sp.]